MKIFEKLKKVISPLSADEENGRKELIINVILIFSITGFIIINLIRIIDIFIYQQAGGLPLVATLIILAFFIFLFWLNKRGFLKITSLLMISTFALPMFYSLLTWGTDLPAGLILAVLVVILTGILFGGRGIAVTTLAISFFLVFVSWQQSQDWLPVEDYWRNDPAQAADAIAHSILLTITAGIAWLFCREINKSLKRARLSEKLLKEERDNLEITVERRTREILTLEEEKIRQLYRFAEFGRLSSGIFHDLINPLSAVSLNLEQINTETGNRIASAKSYLNQALVATHRMEGLIAGIKKQISRETEISIFSLNEEINQSLEILAYKARRHNVHLVTNIPREFSLKGDALKFGQVVTNLLANAIEACEKSEIKEIVISLTADQDFIILQVEDSGLGIAPENLNKIFQPFFSTKKNQGQGLGIGLSLTREIIEKDFKGTISVINKPKAGAVFTIKIPKNYL